MQADGDPFLLPAESLGLNGAIGAINADELLAVYRTLDADGGWRVVAYRLIDPFTSWPPGLSAGTDHYLGSFSGSLTTRADRAFIVSGVTEVWGAQWGVPGTFFESGRLGPRAYLEPSGAGYYQSQDLELRYFASLTAAEPSATLMLPGYPSVSGADATGRMVLSAGGVLHTVEGTTLTPLAPEPPNLYSSAILPRAAGGVWFAGKRLPTSEGEWQVDVWSVEASGSQLIQPLGEETVSDVGFANWKQDGVVVVAGNPAAGYQVAITDGVNVTKAALSGPESNYVHNGLSVVASPDGASVLVGYVRSPALEEFDFAVQRFSSSSP